MANESDDEATISHNKMMHDRARSISEVRWMVENKWLTGQTSAVQMKVLERMHETKIPISKIYMHLLVKCYYESLLETTDGPVSIPLPKQTYAQLFVYIYEKQNNKEDLMRMSKFVFQDIVKYLLSSMMIFDHGHLLVLFEKIYSMCINLSATLGDGNNKFKCCINSLAFFQKLYNQKINGYKKKLCKRLYDELILSLFKTVFIKGYFKDLDTIYKHNRHLIKSPLQKLLVCVTDTDAQKIFSECTQVRLFCTKNVLRWELNDDSFLLGLCKPNIDSTLIELPHTEHQQIVPKIWSYTENSVSETLRVLQMYSRTTQRVIIDALCTCAKNGHPNDNIPNITTLKEYSRHFLNTNLKYVLQVANYNKNMLRFYVENGHDPHTLFSELVVLAHLPYKMLQHWIQLFGPLPIDLLVGYFNRIVQKVSDARVPFAMNCVEMTMQTVLESTTIGWSNSLDVLQALSPFLTRFKNVLRTREHRYLRTVVRCLLTNVYMMHSPALPTTNTPDADGFVLHTTGMCCSICYDDDEDDDNNTTPPDVRILACGHHFHTRCLMQMAIHVSVAQTEIGRCPYCMTPIHTNDLPTLKEQNEVIVCQKWLLSHT
jgi:hypothetical protein